MVACRLIATSVSAVLMSVVCLQLAAADDGQPIAIRHWPGGGISVETMWDLSLGIGIDTTVEKTLPKKLDFKLEDLQKESLTTIDRLPNQPNPKIEFFKTDPTTGDVAVQLPWSIESDLIAVNSYETPSMHSMSVGKTTFLIFFEPPKTNELLPESLKKWNLESVVSKAAIDVSRIDVDAATCKEIAEAMKPALMIVPRSITKVGEIAVETIKHNTIAFAAGGNNTTRIVSLGEKPYEMSDELKELFAKKEAACQASQKFFADLSVEQMNFKPSNGTHTPRWNPEHMMGRELLFFSQIYHAVDPMIPVMNLNPKQNPEAYKFAHPDWTGAEEARQMQRVQVFTRRFAYLLDGMDLDKRAKGSRFWTPRKLLLQMVRHYSEHTGNVKQKMKLPGWPEK
jgi:hypothetical protein